MMNAKDTLKRAVRCLGSPKVGTGIMIAVAAYQLIAAVNAVVNENQVGFRQPKDR